MYRDKTILAVVPARSGSKGIPDKNMRMLSGISLIGWAGRCLNELAWIDAKVLSTDSTLYAEEGNRYGLQSPFLRPDDLSSDSASAIDTVCHALMQSEASFAKRFDIVLIIEPTSPFRKPSDIEKAIQTLIDSGADSVVAVSELSSKAHPKKVLLIENERLLFYDKNGASITSRQALDTLYWRNGVCYALSRECLMEKRKIFTDNTKPLVIRREIVNIDDPIDLEWAEFLLSRTENRKSHY